MWTVLRRYQGVAYEPTQIPGSDAGKKATPQSGRTSGRRSGGSLDAFTVNQRTLFLHQNRPSPPPDDPNILTAPYGAWIYSKLLAAAAYPENSNPVMRRQALSMLLDAYAQKTEHVVLSLRDGAAVALAQCLKDPDEEVRTQACVALELIVMHPSGQAQCLEDKLLPAFLEALSDHSCHVATEALRLCASGHAAHNDMLMTKELVRLGAVAKYVALASSPDDSVCAAALAALSKVFDVKEASIAVLDHDGMKPLTVAVSSRTDPQVLIEAAECIGRLAFFSAGKRAAVHERTVEPIVKLITHADTIVRTAASGALVALTVSEAGKAQAIESGVVPTIVSAIQSEDERDVLINDVKTICNLAEHPVARLQLHAVIPRLEEMSAMAAAEHPTLVRNVELCVRLLKWQPGEVRC